jgi:hypothetical protein
MVAPIWARIWHDQAHCSPQKVATPLWSEIHGLGANVLISRLKGAPRDDVGPDAQEFLKIVAQADVIKNRGAWLEIHQQIQIALWASLPLATNRRVSTSSATAQQSHDPRQAQRHV